MQLAELLYALSPAGESPPGSGDSASDGGLDSLNDALHQVWIRASLLVYMLQEAGAGIRTHPLACLPPGPAAEPCAQGGTL
eukprot:356981-Chlamydomonas_euryale.AAC.8